MIVAHIAGMPVEELVSYVGMSSAGTVVALRVWFGRWFSMRTNGQSKKRLSEPGS